LAAVAYAIDTLKARVPIWKREFYDGDETQSVAAWKQNVEFAPLA
jgi:molybdopterin synthase catalytic subunit